MVLKIVNLRHIKTKVFKKLLNEKKLKHRQNMDLDAILHTKIKSNHHLIIINICGLEPKLDYKLRFNYQNAPSMTSHRTSL